MATNTPNLNLVKPDPNDYYNVSIFNANMEKIDTAIEEDRQSLENAVMFTAQSKTAAEQAQARGNIGAAPDGFGLGGNSKLLTSDDDVNTIGASGWYSWVSNSVPANAIIVSNITIMRVDAYTLGVKVQTLYGATDGVDSITQPIVARRMIYGSKIGTWEYVNPPMYLGIEYRTTERYLGKPVYVKTVNFGAFPNNTIKSVEHGVSNMGRCISCVANNTTGAGPISQDVDCKACWASANVVNFWSTSDLSTDVGYITIKYTKSTD